MFLGAGQPNQERKCARAPRSVLLLASFPFRPSAAPCCLCTAGARPFRSVRLFVWIGGVPVHSSRFLARGSAFHRLFLSFLVAPAPIQNCDGPCPGSKPPIHPRLSVIGCISHPVSRPYAIRHTPNHAPESTSRSALPCCSALKRDILFSFAFQSPPPPYPQLQTSQTRAYVPADRIGSSNGVSGAAAAGCTWWCGKGRTHTRTHLNFIPPQTPKKAG